MRMVKLASIALLTLMILSMIPVNAVYPEDEDHATLTVYKMLLERALEIPNLPSGIRNKIVNILNTSPESPEDEARLIRESIEILHEVENYVEVNLDIHTFIEVGRLSYTADVLSKYAEIYNRSEIIQELKHVDELIKEGEVETAKKLLVNITSHIESMKVEKASKLVKESIMHIFGKVYYNEVPAEALTEVVSNINDTIEILCIVKNRLIMVNASEEAVEAVEEAIKILYNVHDILENVAIIVKDTHLYNRVGNITRDLTGRRIERRIEEIRVRIEILLNESIYIEESLNITLDHAKNLLYNASNILDQADDYLKSGDYLNALKLVSKAESIVDRLAEEIKEYTMKYLEYRGYNKEDILDKYNKLYSHFEGLSREFNKLYNFSLELNSTKALNILIEVNVTLNNISSLFIKISIAINNSEYKYACQLLDEAEDLIEYAESMLGEVKDILDAREAAYKELMEEVNELRNILIELNESVSEVFPSKLINITVSKLIELNNTLSVAEECILGGDISKASELIQTVKVSIEKLGKCIDESTKLVLILDEFKDEIKELRDEYKDVKFIQELLDKAEEMIDKAIDIISKCIKEVNYEILKEVYSIIKKISEIIDRISGVEINVINFKVLDENNIPVLNASIVFNGTVYFTDEFTKCLDGEYIIEVGSIPPNYVFDRWEAIGDIEIHEPRLNVTTADIHGDGVIIMRLRKTVSTGNLYRIEFHVIDSLGEPVSNASIVFNESEYYNEDYVKVPEGNYTLSIGSVPEGYTFLKWVSIGFIDIEDEDSNETIVHVYGNGVITLVLKRSEAKEANISFLVLDESGNIVEDASILLNESEYYSGDNVTVSLGGYKIEPGSIPDGYRFKCWSTEGNITILNPFKEESIAMVYGGGTIIMILEKLGGGESIDSVKSILNTPYYIAGDMLKYGSNKHFLSSSLL